MKAELLKVEEELKHLKASNTPVKKRRPASVAEFVLFSPA